MSDKPDEKHVRVVREGHGANCSSIGSVIDTLFVAQVVASALFAAVAASLAASASDSASDDSDADAEDK